MTGKFYVGPVEIWVGYYNFLLLQYKLSDSEADYGIWEFLGLRKKKVSFHACEQYCKLKFIGLSDSTVDRLKFSTISIIISYVIDKSRNK